MPARPRVGVRHLGRGTLGELPVNPAVVAPVDVLGNSHLDAVDRQSAPSTFERVMDQLALE